MSFCYESLSTVATNVHLRLVKIDVNFWVTKCPPTSVAPGVVALDNQHWLLSYQVYGKLFIYLRKLDTRA